MNYEKILTRIKKTLDLSKNAGTEAEAAAAAERARQMMADYNIAEAELSLLEDRPRVTEAIVDQPFEPGSKRRSRVTWEDTITHATAKFYGCNSYWSGPWVYLYGRESAVQAVRYTAAYLHREVKTLCERAWADDGQWVSGSARSWKNSFRVGAAVEIANRLWAQRQAERRERRQRVEEVTAHPEVADKIKSDALAVVERDEREVELAYAKRSANFGTARAGSSGSSGDGYSSGRRAGRSVSLGGGRAALGRGQGRLKQ